MGIILIAAQSTTGHIFSEELGKKDLLLTMNYQYVFKINDDLFMIFFDQPCGPE